MDPYLLALDTAPMEARLVDSLPDGPAWQFEPKWDGFRCLLFKSGEAVDLRAKSGKPLGRYFPEMLAALRSAKSDACVLDGELVVPQGGTLAFGALQDRIHPAESRIAKLAAETPALLILFDCLASGQDGPLTAAPLATRRTALERLARQLGGQARLRLSPATPDRAVAEAWLADAHGALDGVVAKRTGRRLRAGRARHAEAQAAAQRRLRGRRVSLRHRHAASRLLAARASSTTMARLITWALPRPSPALSARR